MVVLWISGGYIPHVGLEWESQNSSAMVGMRSQDESCGHSKREKSVHGGPARGWQSTNIRAACHKHFANIVPLISLQNSSKVGTT